MSGSPTGDDSEGEVPDYVIEDLLASERRARMLEVLSDRSAPVVLDDLMRTVLAEERGTVPGDVPREDCSAARTQAYEEHLPKLTAIDAVEYDSLVGTVELTDERVARRLDRAR